MPDEDAKYVPAEDAALGYNVKTEDVLAWIEEGKFKGVIEADGEKLIPVEEYQRFGSSYPPELLQKQGERMWAGINEALPQVQQEVTTRIGASSQLVLDRAAEAIQILEDIHKKYDSRVDIYEDHRGGTAAFIIYARVISILWSISALLRSGIPGESFILFRPLYEAVLLAKYFMSSDAKNDNKREVRRWLEKEETPQARDVREYLSKNLGLPIDMLRQLHSGYSKPVHHNRLRRRQVSRRYTQC